MKIKKSNEYLEVPNQEPSQGVSLVSILHPNYDHVPINFCMGQTILEPGATYKPRRFGVATVCYVLAGQGLAVIDNENVELGLDSVVCIPAHSVRYFQNTGTEKFILLNIFNEAWRPEFEEQV